MFIMAENLPKLITIKQAASMLGVTALTLRNWDKSGKLVASRHPLNNYRVYNRDDILSLIDKIASNKAPVQTKPVNKPKKLDVTHLY
ncbi:MAG: MerR family DNA-binding transcriptional regulator [Patescibacteria group bacterium]|nr:MerR family DNA-binding transcriptional regulator [Patescibacteria group bacterium]